MRISRRGLLAGAGIVGAGLLGAGGWALLADARLVPGRSVLDDVLGRCDQPGPPPPEADPGPLVRGSFFSQHRNQDVRYVLAYPPSVAAGASLPVCLVLHGYGDDERGAFDRLGYHRLLAATRLQFVLASVAGGNGYWHPHPSDDPLRMLLEDFPPVLAGHGLATETFAVLGWSMGGFGALLAASEAPGRFVAVVANSPAFWPSYDEARRVNAGAFDSPEQWRRYGDMTGLLGRLPARLTAPSTLRIDCGESDSFYPAIRELLPNAGVVHLAPGCHDAAFWRSVAAPQLTLIGRAMG